MCVCDTKKKKRYIPRPGIEPGSPGCKPCFLFIWAKNKEKIKCVGVAGLATASFFCFLIVKTGE